MAIRKFTLAAEGPKEDPAGKRIKSLEEQIKQANEQLKLAREADSKSDRTFNLQQRVNTLKGQKDRLKKRTDDKKDKEKKSKGEKAGVQLSPTMRCKCIPSMCPHTPATAGLWDGEIKFEEIHKDLIEVKVGDRPAFNLRAVTFHKPIHAEGKRAVRRWMIYDLETKKNHPWSGLAGLPKAEAVADIKKLVAMRKRKSEGASKLCERHGKVDCQSTMCPESPNYNVLTQI